MRHVDDLEDDMEEIIHEFEAKKNRTLLHSVHFYWNEFCVVSRHYV